MKVGKSAKGIGIVFACIMFFLPILIGGAMILAPFYFINSFLNDGYGASDLLEMVNLHYKTEQSIEEYREFYKPVIDEYRNKDCKIPLAWLSVLNLLAQVEPTHELVGMQIDAMVEVESRPIYADSPNPNTPPVIIGYEDIYTLVELEEYVSKMRSESPYHEAFKNVTNSTIIKLIEDAKAINRIDMDGMPEDYLEILEKYDFIYPFMRKANINAPFGYSEVYGDEEHDGIDVGFGGVCGEPIYSTNDGIVSWVGQDGYGANVVTVNVDNLTILYGHMEMESPLSKNELIKKGDFIGTVGNTGKSTGCHLHYTIEQSGRPVDPEYFIDFKNGKSLDK